MNDEIEIPPIKKYRGAFKYFFNGTQYAEETFDTFRYEKAQELHFEAIVTSRVKTGELLKVDITYIVNKDWVPKFVQIRKSLGKSKCTETFENDFRRNNLKYTYENHEGFKKEEVISVPPRMHIATPATSTAFLYLNSKKIDINGKNNFSVYSTENNWEYLGPPKQFTVSLTRDKPTAEEIRINNSKLNAFQYHLETVANDDNPNSMSSNEGKESLKVYISSHSTIPYLIDNSKNGLTVEVKYLNDLAPDD